MAEPGVYKHTNLNGVSWQAVVDLGRGPDGKRRQKRKTFKTRKDAVDWRRKTLTELRQRVFTEPSRELFSSAAAHWLATRDVDGSTYVSYQSTLTHHILPVFGSTTLADISPRSVQDFYNAKRSSKGRHIVRVVLNGVLQLAVDEGLLPVNPAERASGMTQPKTEREVQAWDAATLARFLDWTDGDYLHAVWWTLAHTGLRIGEIVTLRWSDVDLEGRVIQVRRTETRGIDGKLRIGDKAKSVYSNRSVTIDGVTVRVLQRQRIQQAERRLARGTEWHDRELVFDRGDGRILATSTVRETFQRRIRSGGFPEITPHNLRHTHATLLLIAGRPLHYVSKRLGHANPGITLAMYSHVLPDTAHEDADAFGSIMEAARQQTIRTRQSN